MKKAEAEAKATAFFWECLRSEADYATSTGIDEASKLVSEFLINHPDGASFRCKIGAKAQLRVWAEDCLKAHNDRLLWLRDR